MKFDKQLAIILVLVSMLLSAIAVSVYFYNQSQEIEEKSNQLIRMYVAKENLKKDSIIKEEDIKQITMARQYVLTKPLLKKEILGKYVKEPIYKNEVFLKEKISTKIEFEKSKIIDFKYNSYNMAFSLFQNPNYSLEPNDIIKIVSVYPEGDEKNNNFNVQYVAKNIKVLGFLTSGQETDDAMYKKKIKKLVKKKQVEEVVDIKSDELILDMKEKVLLSLINDYNKGNQLWMVKSKIEEETPLKDEQNSITKEIKKEKTSNKLVTNKKIYKPKKKISYPIKWYMPKAKVITQSGLITYNDNPENAKRKTVKIDVGHTKECSKKDKLLITTSNKVYLRKLPSYRAKISTKVNKNYIIAYKERSKINNDWYQLCDESYVNGKDVKEISYNEYKKLKK